MNIFKGVTGTVLMMLTLVLVAAPFDCDLDVYIRVFKIPRIQSWETKLSDERGGITTIKVMGDLTAVFPDGVVFLQAELAHTASDSAVIQAIRDRIFFGGNNVKDTRTSIKDLKNVHLRLDKSHSSEEVQFDEEISPQSQENYRIIASVKSVEKDEIILRIRFDFGWSTFGGSMGVGMTGTIFNQTIALPEHKILLIGFPSHDKGPRGTVFWLAISVIKNEGQKAV
ncbi:MAG: hypothetical protein PVF66_11140 [Candidatus Aminicenantes bacterium]|jgi:hypothetical protein